jgi:hypothetical protein
MVGEPAAGRYDRTRRAVDRAGRLKNRCRLERKSGPVSDGHQRIARWIFFNSILTQTPGTSQTGVLNGSFSGVYA